MQLGTGIYDVSGQEFQAENSQYLRKGVSMKNIVSVLFSWACLFGISDALAASDMATLRISCDEEGESAEVFINGKFKGECSLDVQVPSGTIQVKVVDGQKRVFEKTLRMVAGTSKRVDVEFGVAERAAAEEAEQAAYLAAWKKATARWWQMPADSSYSCSDLEERVSAQIRGVREFSCNCEVGPVNHPAWRHYDQTECNATFEANLIENNVTSFYHTDKVSNQYSYETDNN